MKIHFRFVSSRVIFKSGRQLLIYMVMLQIMLHGKCATTATVKGVIDKRYTPSRPKQSKVFQALYDEFEVVKETPILYCINAK